jgi:two-component system NarL family response regulator
VRAVLNREADIEVIAVAENGEDAIRLFPDHQPDVTIMDLRMPGIGGLQAVQEIREAFPRANIIVLTVYDGDETCIRPCAPVPPPTC